MNARTEIEEMVAKGREKITARRKAAEEDQQEELRTKRADWQEVLFAVRAAFPEVVREYVVLEEAKSENPATWPGTQRYLSPSIEIPGFAPIGCYAYFEQGAWSMIRNRHRNSETNFYDVYRTEWDPEYGHLWSWRAGVCTDSLEEALAYAQEYGEERQAMEAKEKEMNAPLPVPVSTLKTPVEAEYVPVEGQIDLTDVLTDLIRRIVVYEMDRRAA